MEKEASEVPVASKTFYVQRGQNQIPYELVVWHARRWNETIPGDPEPTVISWYECNAAAWVPHLNKGGMIEGIKYDCSQVGSLQEWFLQEAELDNITPLSEQEFQEIAEAHEFGEQLIVL